MAEWPSGTVTFLFTDLEGSTQRWQQYPTEMGTALARHDRLLRDAIAAHGGVVFKTVGDAICAAFPKAPAAVAAALTAQRALYTERWGSTGPLRARMALHTGTAEAGEGDYVGGPLNRVARLLATGYGGQILLSGPTADLVHDYLPPGVQLRDMGVHKLKDVYRPEHIFQLVAPDLPADFEPLKIRDAAPPRPGLVAAPPATAGRRVGTPVIAAVAALLLLAIAAGGSWAMGWLPFSGADDPTVTAAALAAVAGSPTAVQVLPPVSGTATDEPSPAAAVATPPSATPPAAALATDAVTPTIESVPTVLPSPPPAVAEATRSPVVAVTPASPAATQETAASAVAGSPPATPAATGQITFTTSEGHIYRVAAREGATPEDISLALNGLSPEAPDEWLNISPDGEWLLLETERFDPACQGWPCLAVVSADLSSADVVRIGVLGDVFHPGAVGAIASGGNLIVTPLSGGPHDVDLWAIERQGDVWSEPLLLTGDSPYAVHGEPAISADGAHVVFACGRAVVAGNESAICEVRTDGTGFRVVLTPADAPSGISWTGELHHPDYAPDGSIVFEADWDGQRIWRLPPGGAPEPVQPTSSNDNAPCVLSDGRIASSWWGRPGGGSFPELKVMTADGKQYELVVVRMNIEAAAGIGCAA
jgi:class 3 adenylate cyclase